MRRTLALALLLLPLALRAQDTAMPVLVGQTFTLTAPAVNAAGHWVVFGAGLTPDGALSSIANLYIAATDGAGLRRLTQYGPDAVAPLGVHNVSFTPDASRAAFVALLGAGIGREQVHVIDIASGADRVVAIDTQGCIQPMASLCVNCFFTCVNTPHIAPDGGRILYSVRRQNPFWVVNSDGTGLTQLPIYSGSVAPGPQRVISRDGLVVFTSAAPLGPTFAAAPGDVYVMDLSGGNVRNVTKFKDPNLYASNATIGADGSLIAFQSNMQPGTGKPDSLLHVWVVRPDGAGLRPLTFGATCLSLNCPRPGGQMPSISGDGSLVAYLNEDYPSGYRIFVARSDGSGTNPQIRLEWSSLNDPVLSDDASRVVFTTGPKSGGGRGAIYSAKPDGSALRRVYGPRAMNQSGLSPVIPGSSPTPGSLISAYAFNLGADALVVADHFPLPTDLAGVSLLVNGTPAPLLALTPWQLNAQLPQEVAPGEARFQLCFSDGAAAVVSMAQVQALSPAIFTFSYGAEALAAIYDVSARQVIDPAHPARTGDAIEIYGTGLGATNPLVPAGMPAPSSPPAVTVLGVEVTIGGLPAKVLFAGLAPGLAGVYQVNAIVPAGLKPGSYVVRWNVGDAVSPGFGSIAIQ